MTLTELLALAHWSDGLADFTVDVPLFGRPVKFTVAAARDGALSERTAETVRQVQALVASDLAGIHQVVWDNYMLNMEVVSYGLDVREGQTETEANIESFGVRDAGRDQQRQRGESRGSIHEVRLLGSTIPHAAGARRATG